jgi:hypothetical protein
MLRILDVQQTKMSKMLHQSLNFLWCVIPVHELSKHVITISKLSSGL